MKFIDLNRVPFGKICVNVEAIGAVIPAENDPGAAPSHGACVLIQGVEHRVRESTDAILAMIVVTSPKGKKNGS